MPLHIVYSFVCPSLSFFPLSSSLWILYSFWFAVFFFVLHLNFFSQKWTIARKPHEREMRLYTNMQLFSLHTAMYHIYIRISCNGNSFCLSFSTMWFTFLIFGLSSVRKPFDIMHTSIVTVNYFALNVNSKYVQQKNRRRKKKNCRWITSPITDCVIWLSWF